MGSMFFLLSMNSYILRSSKIYAFNFNQRRQEISDAPAKEETEYGIGRMLEGVFPG